MSNNIQEILMFLYRVAVGNPNPLKFDEDNFPYGVADGNLDVSKFDKKEIYDELTDFAFLTLYNNSLIDIDKEKLYEMVKKGTFVREVNPNSFEANYLKRIIQDNGKKTDNGKEIVDSFGQKSIVKYDKKNKIITVTTQCPRIVACDYENNKNVDSDLIVQIIRNSLIHNRFREVSEKEKELYSDIFNEDVNGRGYIFKNYNNSIDILVTESWLREFKKVYFLDSYCYVSSKDNVFYFPRFITSKSTPIATPDELEQVLSGILHTRIVIKDENKNFMKTRELIEETLFTAVYSKDKKLKYVLRNKEKEELKVYMKDYHQKIEDFIRQTLEKNGYKDFEISFSSASLDPEFDNQVKFWKERVKGIYDFYRDDNLDRQLYDINRACNIIPDTGFNKKEAVKGITPQMMSLFLSTIESLDIDVLRLDKLNALYDFVNDPKNLENKTLTGVLNSAIQRQTPASVENSYNLIANKIDTNKYTKVRVNNIFESFNANLELGYVVACASLYNAIIRSGFYEKILKRNADNTYSKVDDETYKKLLNLDTRDFLFTKDNELKPCSNYGEKMNCLAYIRNVLLHGGAEIDYSTISENIGDVRIKFKLDNSSYEVSTTISNIVELCNNPILYEDIEKKKTKKGKKE